MRASHQCRSAFDRSDSRLATGGSQRRTVRTSVYDRKPSSCQPDSLPGRGTGATELPLARRQLSTRKNASGAGRTETTHTNLCNRLVFKCTPSDITLSVEGSRPPLPSRRAGVPGGGLPSLAHRSRNDRRPAVAGANDPNGSAVGAATASRCLRIHHEGGPVSWAYSRRGLFGPERDECNDNRRPILASPAASGIPVRTSKARTVPIPTTPTAGTRRPKAPYHRQVSTCLPELAHRVDSHEPPPNPGFAAMGTASGSGSRFYPRTARRQRASVVHRASSAHCRLPASAAKCHPSTPLIRPFFHARRGKPR